jgi:hypothetical protein
MIVCTTPAALDRHLADGAKEDVFCFEAPGRTVRLENDCRRYPLRLRACFDGATAEAEVLAFVRWMQAAFGARFAPHVAGSVRARVPGLAVKVVAFFPLGEVQVHFYKRADRAARRRIIGRLIGEPTRPARPSAVAPPSTLNP